MQIDWVKYRALADRILQNPAFLEEVKNWELADLLTYADRVKVEIFTTIPADLQSRIIPTEQPDFKAAERLEELVRAEQVKRLEPTPQAKPVISPVQNVVTFATIEAKERALKAAKGIDPPLLHLNGHWSGNYHKLPGLLAFYDFCCDCDYLDKNHNKIETLNAFAALFNTPGKKGVGKNATNSAKSHEKLKGKLLAFDQLAKTGK